MNSYNQDGTLKTDSNEVTTDTLYDIASNTKMYSTNYAIQKLVSDGTIKISDKITKFFPEFVDGENDPIKGKANLTIQNILEHQAGFPADPQYHNNKFNQETQKPDQNVDNPLYSQDKETTKEMILKTPLQYEPGSKTVYSDVDYMLLGLIIEEVTGMDLDDYVENTFYKPLGLKNIVYNPLEKGFEKENIAATELNGNSRDGAISFENIRDYISQFYVYGFKRRKDYDKKSSRSYDNERRRIESWLGEYMCFTNESDGKSAFLSLDSRTVLHNPLYKAFKAKSFTDKDIMLHFYILDILKNKSLSSSEIADEITNEYFSMFESVKECDESTIRKKLNEYEKLGLIKSEKQGRKRIYSLNECDVDLNKWRDALSFFTEVNPIGVIGSYLLDKFDNEENPFRFKHHYIFNALESEVLYDLLDIMNGNCSAEIKLFSNNMQKIKTYKVLPLKIYVSTYYGRRYVLVWNYLFKRFAFYRLDRIKESCKSNECINKNEMMMRADTVVQKLWGVSLGKENYIEKLEMTVRIANGEEYILKRLEREKRNGTIQKLANGDYKFTAEVYDASEMIPWIKTFTGRIVEIKCSNECVEKQIKEDFEMMKRIYEVR